MDMGISSWLTAEQGKRLVPVFDHILAGRRSRAHSEPRTWGVRGELGGRTAPSSAAEGGRWAVGAGRPADAGTPIT
jgi:hypothetical protein